MEIRTTEATHSRQLTTAHAMITIHNDTDEPLSAGSSLAKVLTNMSNISMLLRKRSDQVKDPYMFYPN